MQLDDSFFGGGLNGGKAGRGPENKVSIVAAISINSNCHPLRVKLLPVNGFTSEATSDWAKAALASSREVVFDGLDCFRNVTSNGCAPKSIVAAGRDPKDLPEFKWVNTFLGNLKTSISGTHHSFTLHHSRI